MQPDKIITAEVVATDTHWRHDTMHIHWWMWPILALIPAFAITVGIALAATA